ncbi:dual specificity protein phosphatase family protein [Myxococcaceae bacterium JPH2]|nr:dual specificity protein phosphatase family protein [Myxococcaceae bacterium JPH2]
MSTPRGKLNLDWVTPSLAVGGRFPIEAADHLARGLGISAIVDVRGEARDDERALREHGIAFLHLPAQDLGALHLNRLDDGVAWVSERLARGEKVLIHCEHGAGRSVLLALCVMVARGEAPLEALANAKARRWQVSPSETQLRAFRAWTARWREGHAVSWAVPSVEALAERAYSHLRHPPPVEES